MLLERKEVIARTKSEEMLPALPSDFETKEAPPLEADFLIRDPHYSLYCVDPRDQSLSFIRTAAVIEPGRHPFLYLAQYREAREIVTLPLEFAHRLAASIEFDPNRVTFLHSTGRCGSTLLSRAFAIVPGVVSLSEPDVFTRLPALRPRDGSGDKDLAALCETCVRLLFPFVSGRDGTRLVIKGRSQIMEVADLLWERLPEAQIVFAYRDAEGWLQSFLRSLLREVEFSDEENRKWEERLTPTHPIIDEYHDPGRPLSPAVLWTLGWISSIEAMLGLHARGATAFPIEYAELKKDPTTVLLAVLNHLKLQPPEPQLLRKVLDEDSQAGTPLAQKRQSNAALPAHYLEEARRLIRTRSLIGRSDFRIPGTFSLS
jgi:hypothetical protein